MEASGEASEPSRASRYRVQVRRNASSRTRRILVFAASDAEARATALAETGPAWSVLDVAHVPDTARG